MTTTSRVVDGFIGESYARIALLRAGWRTYTADVDDHGVDLVARSPAGRFYEVQVKLTGPTVNPFVYAKSFRATAAYLVCFVCILPGQAVALYLAAGSDWGDPAYPCLNYNAAGGGAGPYYELSLASKYAEALRALEFDRYVAKLG
ncbi:MAG: hypothetical protein AAF288_10435 [Planctomycetota bacterium]